MTQPISAYSSLDYTAYDPSIYQSLADGTGGSSGVGNGTHTGAEGAAAVPTASSPPLETPEPSLCTTELMKTVAACGSAYLASKVPSPAASLAVVACAANALELFECLTGAETAKAR